MGKTDDSDKIIADLKTSILIAIEEEPATLADLTSYFNSSGEPAVERYQVRRAAESLRDEGKVKLGGHISNYKVTLVQESAS